MTQINLLPWREQIKQEMHLRYAFDMGCHLLLVVFVAVIINIYLYALIHQQTSRNEYVQQQMGFENSRLISLNQEMKELKHITDDLNFILQLKETSYQAVRQLDELIRVVPPEIILNRITRNGPLITLTGDAKSNLQITLLMRNIAASPIFKKPDLNQINVTENSSLDQKRFVLNIQTKSMVIE